MLRNTTLYAYNVRIYYTIDLWTSMTYCYGFWQCKVFAVHLPSARPVYDPAKKCKDTVVSARQIVTLLMYLRLRRRGLLGGIRQLRCFRGRAARTCKKHFARGLKCRWEMARTTRSKSNSKQRDQQRIIPCYLGHQLFTWSAFA